MLYSNLNKLCLYTAYDLNIYKIQYIKNRGFDSVLVHCMKYWLGCMKWSVIHSNSELVGDVEVQYMQWFSIDIPVQRKHWVNRHAGSVW